MIGSARRYTPRSIVKEPCVRCGQPARYQWSACAADNRWMALCPPCDVGLNRVALTYVLGEAKAEPLVAAYTEAIT